MQSPCEERVHTSVMDVVNIDWGKVDIMSLPSKKVDYRNKAKDTNTCRGGPSINRISEQIVLDSLN